MANLRRIEEVVDVNHNGGAFIQLCCKTFRECRLAAPVDASIATTGEPRSAFISAAKVSKTVLVLIEQFFPRS